MADAVAEPANAQSIGERRGAGRIGAFMFAHFTHHVSNTMLAPLQPLIRDAFGLSYAQSGFLVSAFSVSQGLSQAPLGVMADRFGSRRVIVLGLLATAVLSALIGLSGNYWQLLVLLVALGLVAGTYHAPAASLLAQTFTSSRRGAALGMHTVGGNLSFFATPLVAGGLAAATHDWRSPYLAFAIAPALAGIFLYFALPKGEEKYERSGPNTGFLAGIADVVKVIGPLLSVAVLFQMIYAAIYAFLALYLVDARGFEPTTAAFIIATPYIVGLAGSPIGGAISDRIGRKPVILTSIICMGPLLFALTQGPNLLIVPILGLMGLISSARMPVIEGLLLDRAPSDRRATVLGGYYLVAQELGGFAAPLLGAAAVAVGIEAAMAGLGVIATVMSVLTLLIARRL